MAAFSTTKHLTRKDAGAAAAHPASACSGGTGSRKLHLPHSLGCPLSLRGFSVTTSSLPLFDDGPGKDYSVSEVLARSKPAGKAQQRFRKLVATIERKREALRGWPIGNAITSAPRPNSRWCAWSCAISGGRWRSSSMNCYHSGDRAGA